MTTHAELIGLRDTVHRAVEERALAEPLADAAEEGLGVAERRRHAAAQQLADAQGDLGALARMREERDAERAAAEQDETRATELEAIAADLTELIGRLEARQARLPVGDPEWEALRREIEAAQQELADAVDAAAAVRASAVARRERAAALTDEVDQRQPIAEQALIAAQAAVADASGLLAVATREHETAQARLREARAAEAAGRSAYEDALAALIGTLDPAVPLLLLPVRLETRYDPQSPDGSRLLKIRVYVDDIHQDAHERGLTAAESASGHSLWTELWRAGRTPGGAQRRQAAWERLLQRHGAGRSRYLARELAPTNPQARPADAVPDGEQLAELPDFPIPPVTLAPWTRAAHTTVLPDRWLALGYAGGSSVFARWGDVIPRPLDTGPSPTDNLANPTDVGTGMRWMVDFAAAVEVGMGIVVRLEPGDPQHLDRLVVVGVQGTTTPAEGAAAAQELLDAHAYTWGLDLVPQGTPTNNDAERPAGYARVADPAEVRSVEAAPAAPGDASDAAVLAAALGLADPGAALWRTAHAAQADQRDAKEIAAALWPGTWGYYLRQMLAPGLDDLSFDGWRRFTLDTVRARGPLPALRAGNQPYGILPTTSLRRWRPDHPQPEFVLFDVDAAGRARHRVLWDLGPDGGWAASSDHDDSTPGFINPNSDAVGLALFDVDGDGRPELVLLDPGDDQSPVTYGLGPAVEADGTLDGDWRVFETPFPPALTQGAGLAVTPAGMLLIARQTGAGSELAVARGLRLGADGVERWLPPSTTDLRQLGVRGRLAGLAVANATGMEEGADLVALFVEDASGQAELTYLVGRFDASDALQWSDPVAGPAALAAPVLIAGVELCDLDGDGRDELVLHAASGTEAWQFWIGLQLEPTGEMSGGWLGPFEATRLPDRPKAGGAAIADVGRAQAVSPTSPTGLVNLLVEARALWLEAAASGKVPFVGRGDPDRDILDILASDALSSSVAARRLLGRTYQDTLWSFAGAPLPEGVWNKVVARCGTQLEQLGLQISSRLDNAAYVDPPVEWTDPWVQKGPLLETGPLSENYLNWAAKASPAELHDYAGIVDRDVLLLHLARHSTLQAHADAAMRVVPPAAGPWREPELIDIGRVEHGDPVIENDTLTSWRYIHLPQQGRQLGKEMHDLSDARDPRVADLTEVRDALRWLSARPPAALERLLAESLDLAGHRLDAWITAVATARLRGLRAGPNRATGLHIGGYGIVEDLEPAAGPVSTGYVHAPSLAHATTAAVLRSGHLTHRGAPGADTFAVDLSSRRIRAALELVDGIRTGQPLGALLGYRFERALQDHPTFPLARHIAAFRQLAPLAAGKLIDAPAGVPLEAIAARNVVDGLALLLLARRPSGIAWGAAPPGQPVALPPAGSDEQKALHKALTDLEASLDALSDLSIAESVHQAAQGNPTRAGATLDALNRGDLPPAEHDVARSARSGIGAVHRLLVVFEAPGPADPALALWAPSGTTVANVRAQAEPRLNAWAARLLGDPSEVIWQATYPSSAGGGAGATQSFTLKDLRLSPLDVLAVPGAEPGSDLERRMVLHATRNAPTESQGRLPRVNSAPPGETGVPLARLLEVAATARDLVAGSRAAQPADLLASGETAEPAGFEELATRLNLTRGRVKAALDGLRAHFVLTNPAADRAAVAAALGMPVTEIATVANVLDLPAGAAVATAAQAIGLPASADGVRNSLLGLADCGVPGAVPQTPLGTGPQELETLTEQASAAADEAKRRWDAAQTAPDPLTGFEALLGRDFRVLPLFTPSNRTALTAALDERRTAGDAGPAVTEPWLQQLAEVRDGVGRLERTLLLSEALTSDLREGIEIAQLPPSGATPERWVALPPPQKKRIPAGRLSLALHAPLGLALPAAGTVAGLMIDDWVEVVPNREETTAVTFHYNGPGSRAAQALLLAVPPVAGRRWDVETLEDVIAETLDLVAVRSVDPDAMPALGQFLPALTLACNLGGDSDGDTISTKAPLS